MKKFVAEGRVRRIDLLWRWALIGVAVSIFALGVAYVGGLFSPDRLTPTRLVDALQRNNGLYPGYRRNHAKGVCVAGYFESTGAASRYSAAEVFAVGRTPAVGRFAIPGGNPYAPDGSVPIRSMALRFTLANGQQWRTGMNSMPVFVVATPQAFYEQTLASRPDPATGKPDPKKVSAFFASHPETAPFLAWVKTAKPSASFATETYDGLNAFVFVDTLGHRQPVRWRMVPEQTDTAARDYQAAGNDDLAAELTQRVALSPQRWRLLITLASPGDPTSDATKAWPADRTTIDAGSLVVQSVQPQESGPCRDINYDPLVLPTGIVASDDPLLPARSAAYADSYLRRTSEEAGIPGTVPVAVTKREATP